MKPSNLHPRHLLSLLWIFLTVNFIFCDVFTLMYSEELKHLFEGKIGDTAITQSFLLTLALFMEIPMAMIVLSRILNYNFNRWLNIIFAIVLMLIQLSSLWMDENTLHYIFFSVVEIGTLCVIVWIAWNWKKSI